MRAALICLPPPGDGPIARIAGRSAAQCQLELALAADCRLVVVYGHGASPEAIALRHRAEAAGARFQTVNDARALIGAVGDEESLLVLQPGLWPGAAEALADLQAECIMVVPAGAGVEAGFERIDLDRAWAGALVLPGRLLTTLAALQGDIAPAPALLRVALQHRLPEIRLPAEMLDDGRWSVLRSAEAAPQQEQRWLRRVLGEGERGAVAARLAHAILQAQGGQLAEHPWGLRGAVAALAVLLAGSFAAIWYGWPAASFALLALAAPVAEGAIGIARISAAPFGSAARWPLLRRPVDILLGINAVLAIEGLWQRSLFAPLVLVAGLLLLDRREPPAGLAPFRDRAVVCALLSVLVWALQPEPAIMLVAAAVLCVNLAPPARPRG